MAKYGCRKRADGICKTPNEKCLCGDRCQVEAMAIEEMGFKNFEELQKKMRLAKQMVKANQQNDFRKMREISVEFKEVNDVIEAFEEMLRDQMGDKEFDRRKAKIQNDPFFDNFDTITGKYRKH